MRFRHLMLVACATLTAACQDGAKGGDPVVVPTRSDKLIRAAEPVPGSYLVALADGLGEADAAALALRHGATLTLYLPAPVNAALLTVDGAKAVAPATESRPPDIGGAEFVRFGPVTAPARPRNGGADECRGTASSTG